MRFRLPPPLRCPSPPPPPHAPSVLPPLPSPPPPFLSLPPFLPPPPPPRPRIRKISVFEASGKPVTPLKESDCFSCQGVWTALPGFSNLAAQQLTRAKPVNKQGFAGNFLICCALAAFGTAALAQVPPVGVKDQAAQLKSSDAKLAANKKLVYDMYRTIVNGGHYELAEKFFTKGYIQHNPNVASGRDALVAHIKKTRPQRRCRPTIPSR